MSDPTRRRPVVSDRAAADRLDLPLAKRRRWVPQRRMDPESFGAFAERFARFMGTARFLVWMTLFVIVWVLWNVLAPASLVFDPYALLAFISNVMTLLPGDVVATGTPAGVGPIVRGDWVEVEVSGVGVLRNPVT